MKRIVLLLFVCLTPIICQAQKHLRFMDIPLEGSLSSFVNKLIKEKNFHEVKMTKGEEYDGMETRKLIGKFEDFRD